MRAHKLILATLAVSAVAISGAALAATQMIPDNRDPVLESSSAALENAKITLPQAIKEAESSTGGDAVNALLFANSGDPVYLISLQDATGRGIIDVQVDAVTGQMYGDKGPMQMQKLEPQDSGV